MKIKNILIPFLILLSGVVNAQVQYGGVIRAQDNAGTINVIKRTTDNLKVVDSTLAARIPQLTLVGTGLKVDVPSGGFISIVNSSITNLGISAIFTGTGEDVSTYSNIKVNITSSTLSAVDGLQMQQSTNNVDWDGTDIYSIPAATNKVFSIPVNAKFFRIVYTNGGTATTSFRLQVTYHISDKQPSSVRPQDGRSNDNDFVETLSFMMGYNSVTNSWNRVGVANAATGGNENLIDRVKVNAALRMIDNAQASGSKLVNVTGTAALGMDVNLKSVGITSANLGGNETTLDRLKVNASLRMLDIAQPVGSQLVGATGTQALGLNVNIKNTSLPVTISSDADNTATGTLAAAAQTIVLTMGGKSAVGIVISGTWAGTITFEGTVDGTIWNSINAVAASTSAPQSTTTVNGLYRLTPAGLLQTRVIMTVFTSGSATITMRASAGTGGVFANQILPSRITDGTNTVSIKAASTAAAATDIPLIVALHPSSSTPNFATAQAVTGTFFQTTQPVSIATMPTTPVTGTFFQTTQPVSGAFFQATQPVSLATNTPTLAAGTNTIGNINELRAATLAVTTTAAAGTAVTLTLPAVAAQFHYITAIDIVLYSSAARVGAAGPTIVTTTNLPGAIAFTFSTAGAIGTTDIQDLIRVTPLKSSTINTATTIVCPISTGGIWRVTVTYFTAP